MRSVVHTCISRICPATWPTRKAVIKGFPKEIWFGVHGGIKEFYKMEPKEEYPATLDLIVTSVAA